MDLVVFLKKGNSTVTQRRNWTGVMGMGTLVKHRESNLSHLDVFSLTPGSHGFKHILARLLRILMMAKTL